MHSRYDRRLTQAILPEQGELYEKDCKLWVDHDKIGVGMYISRIDDEIITYDVRMVIPNGGKYLSGASMHTIEHLFATCEKQV